MRYPWSLPARDWRNSTRCSRSRAFPVVKILVDESPVGQDDALLADTQAVQRSGFELSTDIGFRSTLQVGQGQGSVGAVTFHGLGQAAEEVFDSRDISFQRFAV